MTRTISLLCISLAALMCVACGPLGPPTPVAKPAGSAGAHQPIDVSEADFAQEVLASDQPVMVDFWAGWCRPCVALAPTVEEIAAEYAGRVKVAKVNVDEAPGLATEYEVSAIPTLLFFRNGAVIERVAGGPSKRQLTRKLDAMLAR